MSHGGVIVLAAGFSRRFGADKRRHTLADGTPLLLASVRRYAAAFDQTLVVLRPGDADLAAAIGRERLAPRIRIVWCADAHLGMGHSLACGARAITGWDWLFVALGDMAWVDDASLAALRSAMEQAPDGAIVQPVCGDTPGHPVGFSAEYLPRLRALTGDEGARQLVRDAHERVVRLPLDDPGILRDLDTPADPDA